MDKIEAISPDPIHIEEHIWEANTCKWLSQIVYRVDLKGTKKVFSSARRKVSMEIVCWKSCPDTEPRHFPVAVPRDRPPSDNGRDSTGGWSNPKEPWRTDPIRHACAEAGPSGRLGGTCTVRRTASLTKAITEATGENKRTRPAKSLVRCCLRRDEFLCKTVAPFFESMTLPASGFSGFFAAFPETALS